ncbi:sulfatase-like hydrolase/transferase [Natrononativus amylolyticus]|uniref:sulfatase-like hydrolase/transferase n=1 Tax=Natrononativus amylolyticus TaxID=2963434 RepID=UPI0020CEFCF7|nr:sulfatase-like hydrolase/transferase [Natrononativus amylolyticus]
MRVALVVLDTLRKDVFDEYFQWLPGRRFEQAWSTAKWTMPAHASLFTGKYASEVGANATSEGLDCPDPVLAELLADAGYRSHAFSANLMVSPVFGFDRGFDAFDGTWRVNVNGKGLLGWRELLGGGRAEPPNPRSLVARGLAGQYRIRSSVATGLARRLPGPLGCGAPHDDGASALLEAVRGDRYRDADFLFVNLMEAHAPYAPPAAYRTVDTPSYDEVAATLTDDEPEPRVVARAYADSVRYLADRYKHIFAELAARFEYVITLSDHGELFGEHGSWRHLHGVYPELTRVPLVISGDGLGGTCSQTVSLLDVHRTILALLDVGGDSRGQHLLAPLTDRFVRTEYEGLRAARIAGMRDDRYPEAVIAAYDRPLTGLAGPDAYYGYETLTGWAERGVSRVSEPRERLRELTAAVDPRATAGRTPVAVPPAVRTRLEDLGYA